MTPGARIAAAIAILDDMAAGLAAEQALTRWARASRFAGSGDRAAVRDHVFDVVRCRRTVAHLGGAETGRALMIGLCRHQGLDLDALFDGRGHAPEPLSEHECHAPTTSLSKPASWDLPDWLVPVFEASLGAEARAAADRLKERAAAILRVNVARTSVPDVAVTLSQDGVETTKNPVASSALTITGGARRLRASRAYKDGLVELQDAASQAMVEGLPAASRVLDYCAGGGGKALAIAMRADTTVFAHDIDPRRMSDLPIRAARAQVAIDTLATADLPDQLPFNLVLCDAPCSGSGAWRRAPEGKWVFTPDRLEALIKMQDSILDKAMSLVAPGGVLVYATCSVLAEENEDRVVAFLQRNPSWHCNHQKRHAISTDNDGFFAAHFYS